MGLLIFTKSKLNNFPTLRKSFPCLLATFIVLCGHLANLFTRSPQPTPVLEWKEVGKDARSSCSRWDSTVIRTKTHNKTLQHHNPNLAIWVYHIDDLAARIWSHIHKDKHMIIKPVRHLYWWMLTWWALRRAPPTDLPSSALAPVWREYTAPHPPSADVDHLVYSVVPVADTAHSLHRGYYVQHHPL